MAFNRYYEDELAFLRDLGDLFARENPKLAGFLSREGSDPDVERLLEGFAFLTARLRQRLDDEMPEVVQGLIELMWPHYLRPMPPTTMIAFDQAGGGGPLPVPVPRGSFVRSQPIDGVSCSFATAYAVDVVPFTVAQASLENRSASSRLVIDLAAMPRGSMRAFEGGRIRLHFNTERDPQVGRVLLLWLTRHVVRAEAVTDLGERVDLDPGSVSAVGFGDDEALLPGPVAAFAGYRLLQEYLTVPAKFLFVDIAGLGPLSVSAARRVGLAFEFARPMPEQTRVSASHIRLNATPAVNLFETDAQPIALDRGKTEYRVVAAGTPGATVHAVVGAVGHAQGRAGRTPIHAFHGFGHDLGGESGAFFRVRVQPAVVGNGIDHYVSFVDGLDRSGLPAVGVVSLRLLASNGRHAERLAPGQIDQPGAGTASVLMPTNLTGVTAEVPPPIADALLWRLVAGLARNFGTIVGVEPLRSLVASFDFRAFVDAEARRRLELLLDGIRGFSEAPADALVEGAPVRLRRLTLTLAESRFGGEAEMFLFASVVDAFLAAYAAINTLHRFEVRGAETNARYLFPPRRGAAGVL